MSASVRHPIMSIEEFLAWEARQGTKFEFDGFEPVAMAGGSARHAAILQNLALAIGTRLRGGPCRFFGSDLKLLTGSQARYPDGQVIYGPIDLEATFSTTPTVVFEVISPGSERTDRVDKAAEYGRIGTVQSYVMLEQDRVEASLQRRTGAGWETVVLRGTEVMTLPEIGVGVALAEFYEGVPGQPGA